MSDLLKSRIDAAMPAFTRSEHRLANFVAANPDCLLLATASEIADRNGISAMTVTRFIRKIGFNSIQDAKSALRQESFGPRVSRYTQRYKHKRRYQEAGEAYDAECFAIKRAYAMRDTDDWKTVIDLIANSEAVFVAGMLTLHHLSAAMVTHLGYIRPNVSAVTRMNGNFIEPLTSTAETRVLVLINIFRYGREGPILASFARERGLKVIVICDESCDWAHQCADIVLPVAIDLGLFLSSTIAIYSMINLILHDVADELGPRARDVLETISEAQDRFEGFMD